AFPTVLRELALDFRVRPKAIRQLGRSLVSAPGNVSLADAKHGLAQRQAEMRVGAAAETPHTDDAKRRLVEWNCQRVADACDPVAHTLPIEAGIVSRATFDDRNRLAIPSEFKITVDLSQVMSIVRYAASAARINGFD